MLCLFAICLLLVFCICSCLCFGLFVCRSVGLFVCLFVGFLVCGSVGVSVCQFFPSVSVCPCLFVCLSDCVLTLLFLCHFLFSGALMRHSPCGAIRTIKSELCLEEWSFFLPSILLGDVS